MAFFYKTHRLQIATRMAGGDKEIFKSLSKANFARTNNKYVLAWHNSDEIKILPEKYKENECCESLFGFRSINEVLNYIESGEYERDSSMEINLFIEDPLTEKVE